MAAERLREQDRGQARVDELAQNRRVAAMRREVNQQDRVGVAHLPGQLIHVGGGNHVAADELDVPQLFLKLGEVLLELGELLGRPRQVEVARPPGINLIDFRRRQFGPVFVARREGPGSEYL